MTNSTLNTIKEQIENMIMADTQKPSHERSTSSFLYRYIFETIVKEYKLTEESDMDKVAQVLNDYLI